MCATNDGPDDGEAGCSPAKVTAQSARTSYGEILKSSVLIGGSSVLSILIRIGRTKALALLLGPSGIGLLGLLAAIEDLATSIAGMGLRMSGVRQIADAVSNDDRGRIALTATVVRRTARWLGFAGVIGMIALSRPIARFTFGDDDHAWAIALLGIAVLFRAIADGQAAVIHGLRRIGDLAKLGPIGGLLGAIVGVVLVFVLGTEGIAPAAVASAAIALVVTWWFGRGIQLEVPAMTGVEVRREATSLLRLGMAFMASGLLVLGSAYVVRLIVLRHEGLEAAGLYQAAVALGSLYVSIILQAMSSDFYPRLVGAADDNLACNCLVNEQAQVSMLLAGPGIAATVSLAPLLVPLFYSTKFGGAVVILQWIGAGMALKVISWPMGMVMPAKNTQRLFFLSELAWNLVGVVLAWYLVGRIGLAGAGYAFFASQVFHVVMTYRITRHLTGFHWSAVNRRTGILFLSALGVLMVLLTVLPGPWGIAFGFVATIASCVYAIRSLIGLVSAERLPAPVRRGLTILRMISR